MNGLLQDARYALRQLSKNPGFALVAVLTLALGIGANTAIFSVVNSVLLRPLPYEDSGRIVRIWGAVPPRGLSELPISDPEFLEYRLSRSFDHVGALVTGALNLTDAGDPQRLTATWVSADVFPAMGAETVLGRVFSPEEDQRGRNQVVVLSHRIWQTHFGADPNIVGKSIALNNEAKLVVGVMHPSFKFPAEEVDAWIPLAMDPASKNLGLHYLGAVGHLAPGATMEQATAEIKSVAERIKQKYPEYYKDAVGFTAELVSLQDQTVGNIRPALWVLMGGVGFMLLICCANVANLLLARAAGRRKEIATRLALGASRRRIVYQLLTESIAISLLGGAIGVLLALWGVRVLVTKGGFDFPRMQEVGVDERVLWFTLLTAVLTGLIFGLAPALRASRSDLNDTFKESDRSGTGGKASGRIRSWIVISEIAFSLVLLAGTGLKIGSFVRLLEVNLGFDPGNVLTMQLSLPQSQYAELPQVSRFYHDLIGHIEGLPGVKAVAVVSHLPMTEENATASFEAEGHTLDSASAIADYRLISPNYFRVMNITLIRGRTLDEEDQARPTAVVINQTMARKFWPHEDVIGQRIRLKSDAPWLTVVGVVADVKNHGPRNQTKPEMYLAHSDQPIGLWADLRSMTLIVRSASSPLAFAAAIRGEIRNLDGKLPVYKIQSMEQIVAGSISETRFTMELLSLFGGLALILAAVGVYGAMAYSVAQRTQEVGIRKALGATPHDIAALFVRQGYMFAFAGVTIGLAGALSLTRVMSNLLYAVSASDPMTFVGTSVLLVGATLLPCYVAAHKAARLDPMVALRYE